MSTRVRLRSVDYTEVFLDEGEASNHCAPYAIVPPADSVYDGNIRK